jgi:malate/lactate dehydrogenase
VVVRGSVREVVLVNRDRKRTQGVLTDVQYGADLAGSSVVMITAGVNEKGTEL